MTRDPWAGHTWTPPPAPMAVDLDGLFHVKQPLCPHCLAPLLDPEFDLDAGSPEPVWDCPGCGAETDEPIYPPDPDHMVIRLRPPWTDVQPNPRYL